MHQTNMFCIPSVVYHMKVFSFISDKMLLHANSKVHPYIKDGQILPIPYHRSNSSSFPFLTREYTLNIMNDLNSIPMSLTE